MGKKVSEIYQLSPLTHGRTDIYQTMYLAWTTVVPCSLSHETPQKILPPLLFLWLHYYISWRLRVKMFVHTWRCTNSVLNTTYYVGEVYILVHTEAGKLVTETILRIPGRTAVLLLPGRSDLRGPPTASFSYLQDEMYNSAARKHTACQLCEATSAPEPILENLTYNMFLLGRLNMRGISSAMC